jgi:hypothetical protein
MEVLIQAFSVFIRVSEEIGPISSPRLKLLYDEMLMLHQDHIALLRGYGHGSPHDGGAPESLDAWLSGLCGLIAFASRAASKSRGPSDRELWRECAKYLVASQAVFGEAALPTPLSIGRMRDGASMSCLCQRAEKLLMRRWERLSVAYSHSLAIVT